MFAARALLAALVLGLSVAGCGPAKLNVEKKYTLEPDAAESIILDPQSKPQKITVEFSSTAADVSVYLIKSEEKEEELLKIPAKDKTLGSKSGKEGSFSADVPENTMTRVLIRGANNKTVVTVKVSNTK